MKKKSLSQEPVQFLSQIGINLEASLLTSHNIIKKKMIFTLIYKEKTPKTIIIFFQ